jgi:DNA ligase-associated metallophosphoesterase
MDTISHSDQLVKINLKGHSFILHPYKAMYWESEQSLILSDLHLGKGQHFRKNGIGVPADISLDNFNRLDQLINIFQPKEVLILGDLFHSTHNVMWDVLEGFCKKHSIVDFRLVPGNHDILERSDYQKAAIALLEPIIERQGFVLSHHPTEDLPAGRYNLHGHIHPGVRLHGKGRQSIRLPAFYFGTSVGILPAFGAFTGLAMIYPQKGDQVFGIIQNQKILQIEC